MIVGSQQDGINVAALVHSGKGGGRDSGGNRLVPRLLNDGTYALPASALTEPGYEAAASILSGWATQSPPTAGYYTTTITSGTPLQVRLGDKTYYTEVGRQDGVTMPYAGVIKFQCEVNDFADVFDYGWPAYGGVNKRRSVLVGTGTNDAIFSGDVIWVSLCFIPGDTPGYGTASFAKIFGFHSEDYGVPRSGIVGVDCGSSEISVYTRSSAVLWPTTGNGVEQVHYTTPMPSKGTPLYIVMQATIGQTGHVNVWLNGSQVVNLDCPIGYYADLVAHPGAPLGSFMEIGVYTNNQPTTEVQYVANMEWGTTSLAGRITTPLTVPPMPGAFTLMTSTSLTTSTSLLTRD